MCSFLAILGRYIPGVVISYILGKWSFRAAYTVHKKRQQIVFCPTFNLSLCSSDCKHASWLSRVAPILDIPPAHPRTSDSLFVM